MFQGTGNINVIDRRSGDAFMHMFFFGSNAVEPQIEPVRCSVGPIVPTVALSVGPAVQLAFGTEVC